MPSLNQHVQRQSQEGYCCKKIGTLPTGILAEEMRLLVTGIALLADTKIAGEKQIKKLGTDKTPRKAQALLNQQL